MQMKTLTRKVLDIGDLQSWAVRRRVVPIIIYDKIRSLADRSKSDKAAINLTNGFGRKNNIQFQVLAVRAKEYGGGKDYFQ